METKLKVGDKVRITGGSAPDCLGNIATILDTEIDGYNDFYLIETKESRFYLFESHLKLLPPKKYRPKKYPPLQGKFTLEDGTPGVVNVFVYGNVTQVTIIVGPKYEYKKEDVAFFNGFAYCNPNDIFDLNTGIRVACIDALFIGSGESFSYTKSIFSAIRKAMRESHK